MAPIALLSATAAYAQWPQSYGNYDDYDPLYDTTSAMKSVL
jgi:hypothetical protein